MDKKRVSVFVAGQRFNIITDEDEKYVIDIAAKIDARISSLSISQNIPRERAAVLTALDFADDNEQDKRAIVEIKEQIKDYVTQISRLSEENTALNAESNQIKRELAAVKEAQSAGEASLKNAAAEKAADDKEKEALKAQIRDLEKQADSFAQQIESLEMRNREKEDMIAEQKKQIAEKEAYISEQKVHIAEQEEFIGGQKDQIARLEEQIGKQKEQIEKLEDYIGKLEEHIDKLKDLNRDLEEKKELFRKENAPAPAKNVPAAEEVTAEDDLFFDMQEESAPKPQKEKKNRHEHNHVNPYKQQFMNKKNEQKGYTQQRQYSLFDTDD